MRIERRAFIALFASAIASPHPALPQQTKLPTIGFLVAGTPSSHGKWVAAFVDRLGELGWIDGHTIAVEYRWAEGRSDRTVEIATGFVGLNVDAIVTSEPQTLWR